MDYFCLVVSANINQSNPCLPDQARGRQCVPCSLMFLIISRYIKHEQDMQSEDLHNILHAGSHLYCAIKSSQVASSSYMDPQMLPEYIVYQGQNVHICYNGVVSGFVGNNVQNDGLTLFPLKGAMQKKVEKQTSKYFILVFCGVSVGIHSEKGCYYVFDSHSRNQYGLCCADGTSVLGLMVSLNDFCVYISQLVMSMNKNPDVVQFDLHYFVLQKNTKTLVKRIEIFDNSDGYRIVDEPKRKRKESHSSEKRHCIEKLMKGKSFSQCVDDCNVADGVLDIVSKFHNLVAKGPDYVCSCCTQTFFKHYVKKAANLHDSHFLNGYKSVQSLEWICSGCYSAIRKGQTPKFWLNNGLAFPTVPKELQLSQLEERLVSPRLPFMQLREMPRGGQINMRGNVVNVPADVNSTIRSLPRMVCDSETIMLKLKRKLSYKHHVAFENIRPNKVFEAAAWLVSNSVLFQKEGIFLNETWLQQTPEFLSFCSNNQDCNNGSDDQVEEEEKDTWTEDENFNDRISGNMDTCLQACDFREFNQVICVAPGQDSSPISIFQDIYSEILSFPSIFCGKARTENTERIVPLHYSDICKWELRNVDRRVALSIPNLFFKLKRLQIKQIKDKVSLAIRKCKTKGRSITAGELLAPGFVDSLTMQNDGYRVLRTMRGSPPYWEQAKRDVFSMIRQLGIPTWFCSFSAAETKWEPLLQSLSKLVNNKDISINDAKALSWQEKSTLIKSDPVTCARYFDQRVQTFIKHVLKHSSNPVGEISDFFYRIEFQQRGSPHVHMLVWIKGAPVHGESDDLDVISFVDKYVTCKKDESMTELINYQTHRHARTCRKKGKDICRFNFPLYPMPETSILYPLEKEQVKPEHAVALKKITSVLNDIYTAETNPSFEEFLAVLDMDYRFYVESIRSSLNRTKIFLNRTVNESRINSYNKTLIQSWMANMDLQFVLDPFSCVSYIVSYISKGQRGLSNLLRDACSEAQQANSDIRQQVRKIGNQFLSSVEIGAQEAVYLVLQMPLRRCTRDVIFVDTRKPDERTSLIKPMSQLKELPGNSKNVEMDNVLKRYKRRPNSMKLLCYADFASWYELCKGKGKEYEKEETCEEELPETEYKFDQDDDIQLEDGDLLENNITRFPCGTCVRKRCRQKVIYSHVVPINQDREEYFRQNIMLYTHWRVEEDLIRGFDSFEESFTAKLEEINLNKMSYERCAVDESIQEIDDEHLNGIVNAESCHQDSVDMEERAMPCRPTKLDCFDPGAGAGDHETYMYDLGEDIGLGKKCVGAEVLPQKEITNDVYFQQMQELNNEQRKFFYHILHMVKTNSLPFYTFLSGGGGVGKSVVVRNIYQGLLKYFNHCHSENPDTIKLLLCAPTGKAAHNIGGVTIHSAFSIPANQGFHFKPLDMQQLNTMRARFQSLKVVIIDEISMVGRSMFNFINLRLQEIMACTKPFGNVSILAVGDLFQLKPVMDSWIFSQSYAGGQMASLASNLWVELFTFFELKIIMRQKDDVAFAEFLNRLREGLHTDDDLAVLHSRLVMLTDNQDILHLPHLYCTRKDVANHNLSVLSNLQDNDITTIESIDELSGDVSSSLRETILSRLPDDTSQTMGLQRKLTLGKGLQAEICLNIDTSDGLTNGASCCIKWFDYRVPQSSRCSIIWVLFDDSSVGKAWRAKYRHLYTDGISLSWTPILEVCRKFCFRYFKTYIVVRRQFPLYLSAGKTIHKAQGSTLKKAVMHFGNRKTEHIHYVGLSRVTSLSGVHISELNESKICVSHDVEMEMERLRGDKHIVEVPPCLNSFDSLGTKICFHNCRSLRKHIDDFRHESNLISADIIGLVETRLWGELDEKFKVEGFHVISASQAQSPHGLAIYYRRTLDIDHIYSGTLSGIEYCLLGLKGRLVFGFVYCPPNIANLSVVSQFLGAVGTSVSDYLRDCDKNLVLMGDFNYDPREKASFLQLFSQAMDLEQLISCITTDYDSCLDHIYTNIDKEKIKGFGTLESYYSDHKPLFTVLDL